MSYVGHSLHPIPGAPDKLANFGVLVLVGNSEVHSSLYLSLQSRVAITARPNQQLPHTPPTAPCSLVVRSCLPPLATTNLFVSDRTALPFPACPINEIFGSFTWQNAFKIHSRCCVDPVNAEYYSIV